MLNRKAILVIAGGLAAAFCITMGIVFHNEKDETGNTIIVVYDGTSETSESESFETSEIQETKEISITSAAVSSETEQKTTSAKKTTSKSSGSESSESAEEILWININTADAEELMKLDGIGEATASNIIAYRDAYGEFHNVEELLNVDGIGEKKLENIYDCIYVDNPTYDYESNEISEEIIEDENTGQEVPEVSDAQPQETESVRNITEAPQEQTISAEATEHELTLEEAAPIDINNADVEELMLLPYVTEEVAESIIELREAIGGYSHPYELLYIDELEQKEVAEIIEFVTVGDLQ